LLGRPLEVSLTKDSGLAGLIFLIRQHLGWDLPKDDPGLLRVYGWMSAEFDNGRQTSIEWEEVAPLVRREIPAPQAPLAGDPAVPAGRH
jgi:2-phosphinomethylmalic acid synthase